MDHCDNQLFDYLSKRCKTYDPKSRSIHTSELHRLCSNFKLDYRSVMEYVKSDPQGHVTYSELLHFMQHWYYHEHESTRHRMPSPGPPHSTYLSRPSRYHDQSTREISSLYTKGIPFDTSESYTPPEDSSYHGRHQQEMGCLSPPDTDMDASKRAKSTDFDTHHWNNTHTPDSPPGQQWTDNMDDISYGKPGGTRAGMYCTNCSYWQKRAQDSEDHLVVVSREKDKLQTHVDRLQKELQQSSDYYSAYQMVLREKERYKQEVRRLKEGNDSDGSRSYAERQYEELKRSKDEMESSLKQYKRHYGAMKQENERMQQQLKNQQCETWMLRDEKQKLEFLLIQKDSRHLGEEQGRRTHVSRQHPMLYPQSVEHESDKPVKGKSHKSAPSEASDTNHLQMVSTTPNEQAQVFMVLGEDVATGVLPEGLTQEHHLQMICALQNCHSIEELIRCLISYSSSSSTDEKSHGLKVDNEHLCSQVKHLEAKYQTLTSSFETAKQEKEEMYHKLSTVENNNCRLRHAVKLCQQACEVHELLYEMKEAEGRPTSTGSAFSPIDYGSPTRTTPHDPLSGKNLLTRARSVLHHMETNQELQTYLPTVHGKTTTAGWNLSMSQYTGTTSGLSCSSSVGPEAELNSTEVEQLKVYYQALVCYSNYLLDTLVHVDGLKTTKTIKEAIVTKDSQLVELQHSGRVIDMEDCADTEELCKIREEKAELRSQIYMMEQSKRSMELQVSRLQIQHAMLDKVCNEQQNMLHIERKKRQRLKDKVKLLKAENPHLPDWTEQNEQVKSALERENDSVVRYEEMFVFMQSHVQKSQVMTEKLVGFVKELLRANRALVEAFERAKKRQQVEKKQWKSEIIHLMNKTHSTGQLHPVT